MPSDLIEHGASPSYDLINETGIVMKQWTWKPERDVVDKKDANDKVIFRSFRNPRLMADFSGRAVPNVSGALEGLAIIHPGTANTFANWASSDVWHGFTFASGNKMIVDSIQTAISEENDPEISGTCGFWPGIANSDLDDATS